MVEFFHLNPKYFPEVTKAHLPLDAILRLGALPLGVKRGWRLLRRAPLLNVGFVEPHRWAVKEVRGLIAGREDVQGLQVYRVRADEFIEVVTAAYGMTRAQLRQLPDDRLAAPVRAALADPPPATP